METKFPFFFKTLVSVGPELLSHSGRLLSKNVSKNL